MKKKSKKTPSKAKTKQKKAVRKTISKQRSKVVVAKREALDEIDRILGRKVDKLDVVDGEHWFTVKSKLGRDIIFDEPKKMLAVAVDYLRWIDANPEKRAELVKYEGSAVQEEVDVKRLATLHGLTRFMHVSRDYLNQFERRIREKKESERTEKEREFLGIIPFIKDMIEEHQIAGAASGFFNGNIISRLNNLVERKDVTTGDGPIQAPHFNVYNTGPKLAGSEEEIQP